MGRKWRRVGVLFTVLALLGPVASAGEAFTFVQLCDPQLGFGGYQRDVRALEQAIKQINTLRPDLVVVCGDLVNIGANAQAYADYKRVVKRLKMPCYSAPGNHDVGEATPELLEHYRRIMGKDYYVVEHKGHTFVVANSQFWNSPASDESRRHDAWLKASLEAASAKHSPVIVVTHHPLYADQPDEPQGYFNIPPDRRKELLDAFKANGVVAVLTGHSHRTTVNEYAGIKLVSSATTSVNFDKHPLAFRVWHVGADGSLSSEVVPVDTAALTTGLRVAGRVSGLKPGELCQVMLIKGRVELAEWNANTVLGLETRVVAKADIVGGGFEFADMTRGKYTLVALGISQAGPSGPLAVRAATKTVRLKRRATEESATYELRIAE